MNLYRMIIWLFCLCFIMAGALPLYGVETPPDGTLSLSGDKNALSLTAENVPASQIIRKLKEQFSIAFTGLDDRTEKRITLSCSGPLLDVIQKLLKAAAIENYAFTFNRDRLTGVGVFPQSSSPDSDPLPEDPAPKHSTASAVKIQSVIEGTQASRIGLQPDDIIIAYNGKRIIHAHRLVHQVERDESKPLATLVILRDGNLEKYDIDGGFIGVQVVTIPMDAERLEAYFDDLGI